jgi:hypothetical protein
METLYSSETSVTVHQLVQCNTLEDWVSSVRCSVVSSDYLLSTAAGILNGQSPHYYSLYKYITCSVEFEM